MVSDYKENPVYRQSFNRLADRVFGIDFEKWYQDGFWNDRYICYSYLHQNEIVSNVSVSLLDLIINSQSHPAALIGTVMTHTSITGNRVWLKN